MRRNPTSVFVLALPILLTVYAVISQGQRPTQRPHEEMPVRFTVEKDEGALISIDVDVMVSGLPKGHVMLKIAPKEREGRDNILSVTYDEEKVIPLYTNGHIKFRSKSNKASFFLYRTWNHERSNWRVRKPGEKSGVVTSPEEAQRAINALS